MRTVSTGFGWESWGSEHDVKGRLLLSLLNLNNSTIDIGPYSVFLRWCSKILEKNLVV